MDVQKNCYTSRKLRYSLILKFILALFLCMPPFALLAASSASSDHGSSPPAIPFAIAPPVIDGKLDEPAWEKAMKFENFKTFKPDFGKDGSQNTIAYLTYDAENLYFALKAFESDHSRVKASICRRDAIGNDDTVGFILDTFNNMQSAYAFMLNPFGIQADGMMNSQGNVDVSLDLVWYSKGQVASDGWVVEARIPLKSLRFPNKKQTIMRVAFFREISRTSEGIAYPSFAPDKGSVFMQMAPVVFSGLKYKRVAEFIPAVTYGNIYNSTEGRLVKDEEHKDISLTGKLGLTSDLVLDGAYNPDFSQVEADAGQIDINLRYQLYFPEKRPFFMEGNDLWDFGGMMEEAPVQAVVYTRRIINPDFAFKLAGKVSSRDTVAVLYAKDNLPNNEFDKHPDFIIARYKHAFKGDSFVGGFFADRESNGRFNRVGGIDGRLRLSNTSTISFHLFGSLTREGDGAGTDKDHALCLNYSFSNRRWIIDLGYQDVSPDFQVDTGFVMRTGLRRLAGFAMYQIYPKSSFFQKIEPFYWGYQLYDTTYKKWESINVFVVRFQLPRSSQIRFEGILGNEIFSGINFDRSAFGFQVNSQIFKQLFLRFMFRRGRTIFYDPNAPYQGYGSRIQAGLQYQPDAKLDFSLNLVYADFYRKSDHEKIYDYTILRSRNTFQLNKYLFLRGIVEYNLYRKRLTADGLISFTYIPGTVFYVGYGSAFQKLEWNGTEYVESDRFLETKRGFFFKISYLWRF